MKVAVVTGASRGIGEAVIDSLLREDWKVYGLSRTKPAMAGVRFEWLKCDLARPADISRALAEVTELTVELFVSNSGVAFKEPATAVTEESFKRMYFVNVLAPMLIIAALKNKLAKSTIISLSSVSDRFVEKDLVLYGSSKAANTRFFDTLAAELPAARVYALLPDYVDTPMLRQLMAGVDFDWSQTLDAKELAALIMGLAAGSYNAESGANIIVINDHMKKDLEPTEKLYGFNADTGELAKLRSSHE